MRRTAQLLTLSATLLWAGLASAEDAAPEAEAPPAEAEAVAAAEPEPAPPPPPTVEDLLADMQSPVPRERVDAIRALTDRGDPAAVEPIAAVLRSDSSVLVRGWAARSLSSLGTPEATAALATAATADPDQRVRSLAARLAGLSPEMARPRPAPARPVAAPSHAAPMPERRPRPPAGHRLQLGGWILFAASYGIAMITGTSLMAFGGESLDYGWKLMLPVVGPGIAAATAPLDDEWERRDFAAPSVTLWIFTGIQATGVILLSIGHWQEARARRAEEEEDSDEELSSRRPSSSPSWVLAPGGPGGLPGVSVAGWF